MGDGLQDVPVSCHIADSPLAQPSATQSEDVAERKTTVSTNDTHQQCSVEKNMTSAVGKLTLDLLLHS